LFWLYKSKRNKQGEAPIYLRVTYNKERKNLSTAYNINPSRWDRKDVDRIYLPQNELAAIIEKEFKLERLRLVRDLFLFQCYTGFANSDMAKLRTGNISPGIDGNKWIIIRRKKLM
jgi:hypothetical protein